jgi:hypothetical protein
MVMALGSTPIWIPLLLVVIILGGFLAVFTFLFIIGVPLKIKKKKIE